MLVRPARRFAILVVIQLAAPALARAQTPGPLCIDCPPPGGGGSVSVTPDGATTATRGANTGGYSATFTVKNWATFADTIAIGCLGFTNVTCTGVSASSVILNSGDSTEVTASYNVGSVGTGRLRLRAFSDFSAAIDTGWYNVPVGPTVTLVAPVLTSGSRALVRTRQPLVRATFLPGGTPVDTARTSLTWRGEDVTTLARANRGLIEWEPDSSRWLNVGDSAQIAVTGCAQGEPCTTVTRWAVLASDSVPVLGFSGVPVEALGRQFSAPFGPGLSVSGAEVETGLATAPYFSMGAARSAGLVYSTRQSYPRALVPVDLELPWPAGAPDQVKLTLFDGATKLDSLVLATPTCATGAVHRCRAVLQADFAGSSFSVPTRKWLTVEARVTVGPTTKIGTDSVEVVVVDRRTTAYGSGWWPAGVLKLVGAGTDRVLVGPTGTAGIYRGNGDSLYVAPPGDFSVLKKTSSGWELSPRGSLAKLVFDTNGRLVKSVDQNGNRDSIVYSGASDQVTSLIDPVGKAITFGYDGNAKLATFTDPGNRQTKISISAATNQLTYDSLSSAPSKPYTTKYVYTTYPGTSTVVLTQRIGVILDTTIVTYDSTFTRRPVRVALPLVPDENGNPVKPTVTYTVVERQGYGALRSLDSVYVEVKDPRNNWTRSLLNRWGAARQTWDSLGMLGRAAYTAEGFALWSEGKVPDSSRVYNTYDGLRRLARTYLVRAAGDTLRLDSLVYDANHRVIRRIDARGKIWRTYYDGLGNVIASVRPNTPSNDSTSFWYGASGQLDSLQLPAATQRRKFTYDPTWRNTAGARDESNTLADSVLYDALGRDTASFSKARVQVTETASQWQWRKRQSFYNVANQVDSTRLLRTDNCNDPCSTPPAWPASSDTLKTQRVGHRFDRAGRDSLRLNDRGKAVLYLYDRLGRLVSRRPWTDSMAVKDSFVYDVAGNLKKAITRRGDTFTTNYDSRNRDTLAVIPGIGTLRKAFGGPMDQLARLWYDNPVDSIGGVNAEVRWGYDQRGRLKADTSFAGSIAQAATYAYDTYERPVTLADPVGMWAMRYETNRSYADTLITPFGDTITYTFDARGRPVGPSLRSGGGRYSRRPTWGATGVLSTLTDSVVTTPGFETFTYNRNAWIDEPGEAHTPLWTEQHGAGAPIDSLRDSVRYDGWERVIAWVQRKIGGGVVARDTFQFDRTGNIKTTAGVEVYDVTTDRLASRAASGCGSSWAYTYDRAGNLTQAVCGSTTWVYTYDALSQLRAVRYNGTVIARYAYDVLGRRVAKRVYSSATGGTVAYTRFVYHGAHVAFETDSVGNIGLRYTWGLATDDVLAMRDAAGNHYYVVQDVLHSVRGLVKRDGTWVMSQRFGPYGALIARDTNQAAPPPALRYGWTGREYDAETGWYYFRARYYDPAVRRFVQEDPIGYGGGTNVYAYADGGPLEARDPTGMRVMDPPVAVMNEVDLRSRVGGGGSNWDPWGQEVDFFEGIWNTYYAQEAHVITICNDNGCNDMVMYVSAGHFDGNKGHETSLAIAGAEAAIAAGVSSFTVSCFACPHVSGSAHLSGDAMDVSMLGDRTVRDLAASDSPVLSSFIGGLMRNLNLPYGSVIMAPWNFGARRVSGSFSNTWVSINMYRLDLRGSPSPSSDNYNPHYGETWGYEHAGHVHVEWGER